MAYCGPRALPLSQFLAWDEADQHAALIWQAQEARRCSGCGTLPEEWDVEQGGSPDAYHAAKHLCLGCAALANVHEDQPQPGRVYRLIPNPVKEA